MNIKTISFIGGGLILTGLIGHIARQIYLVKQIDYNMKGFVINDINQKQITATVILELENKSDIEATIEDYDIDFYINGTNIGKINYNKKQIINANGKTNILIRFDIPFKQYLNIGDVLKIITNYLTDKSKIALQLKGSVIIKHSLFKIDLPINESFKLSEFM